MTIVDAGQAALPGGKSDSLSESPLRTARREAYEEIGLPEPLYSSNAHHPPTPTLPFPFTLEHLCILPVHLAKTALAVAPVVALLHASDSHDQNGRAVDAAATLIPRLDAREVAAVFSAPLHNFLLAHDETPSPDPGSWYSGVWIPWHDAGFRMHSFYVPVSGQTVTRPGAAGAMRAEKAPYPNKVAVAPVPYAEREVKDALAGLSRFRVFGMTARIMVDCARVAYAQEPEFEHNSQFGDEVLIRRLMDRGELDEKKEVEAEPSTEVKTGKL